MARFNQEKPPSCVRFFQKPDENLVLFGSDAYTVSRMLFGSASSCKTVIIDNVNENYLTITKCRFDKVARDLLVNNKNIVELYRDNPKSNPRFQLVGRGSPGNYSYFEDIVYEQQNEVSMAIVCVTFVTVTERSKVFSMCFYHSLENRISYIEYDDFDNLSETESIIVQINPSECIIPQSPMPVYQNFEDLIGNYNILLAKVKQSDFKSNIDIVSSHIENDSIAIVKIESPNVLKCLSVLMPYITVSQCNIEESETNQLARFELSPYNRSDFMCLDVSAISSLSILPGTEKSLTLFNLLNNCKTKEGQRLLNNWIRQPLKSKHRLETRLNLVEYFVDHYKLSLEIYDQLKSLPDTGILVKRISTSKARLLDCVKMYFGLKKVATILDIFISAKNDTQSPTASCLDLHIVSPLQESFEEVKKFCTMIESLVDLNINPGEEYRIKNDADSNLQDIQDSLDELAKKIDKHFQKVCDKTGLEPGKTLKKEFSQRRGYYFRVTLKFSKHIDESEFQVLESLKDGIYFVDDIMKRYSDEYCTLQKDYNSFQAKFIKELSTVAVDYVRYFKCLSNILAFTDVLISFSLLPTLTTKKFVKPVLLESESGLISIKNGRHPCLETSLDMSFIPNDLELSKNNHFFIILTGPNMGGKSTYLRQSALIILMAQIGCFVPCDSAHISLVDKIITRVGASDYTLKGFSTFMAEMVDACSIIRHATPNSFVIIDELGRGTSTYDGFGLGWSISEHIAKEIQCYTIFATHFHEITHLEHVCRGVKNYMVETHYDSNDLIMCYRVVSGSCNMSFGVKVAELLKFPKNILNDANDILKIFEDSKVNYFLRENEEPNTDEQNDIKSLYEKIKRMPLDQMTPEELDLELKAI
ncbi:DNA mismatch repair protein Msh2 [Thelohanellus kitauei]|uniref:DNA mismatch repair protein Msh2 n=1 Tax=Thelohanellus kitauei TaxID=669202 RepID=A0A0C2MUZ3_THEKT|nr:DNA mismatch repair protein Msh2 [Thelohanellus kitauei]